MSVLFVALPVALLLAALAVAAFVASVRGGQFDDLDTPAVRMLFDDPPAGGPRAGRAVAFPPCSIRSSRSSSPAGTR